MEGSELFRHAENWLNSNPGKTLKDYKLETGYSGPALKQRQRAGQPVRISYKGKSANSQTLRATREVSKTEGEAANRRAYRRSARQRSQSTLHQHTYGGRPSIAEHDVRLASGGSNEYMSISDPDFKAFKDEVEAKAPSNAVIDIDDVSGEVRAIPKKFHNKFQPTSKQPGFNLNPGDDILGMFRNAYRALNKVPGGRSAFAAIPFIGDAMAAPDIAAREVKAAETGNPVDEIQSQLAGAGQIPLLGAVPDLANAIIDNFRAGNTHRRIRGRSGAQKALNR